MQLLLLLKILAVLPTVSELEKGGLAHEKSPVEHATGNRVHE
jgi:hypothetical protein